MAAPEVVPPRVHAALAARDDALTDVLNELLAEMFELHAAVAAYDGQVSTRLAAIEAKLPELPDMDEISQAALSRLLELGARRTADLR